MLKSLLRLNQVRILEVEETFFKPFQLDKISKLDSELLKLNYQYYAPYLDPELLGYKEDEWLYVWFFQKKTYTGLYIPEAHIFYSLLKKEHSNSIVLLNIRQKTVVIVIRNRYLLHAFAADVLDELQLQMIKDDYGISDVVRFDEAETALLYEKAKRRYSPLNLLQWLRNSVKVKPLLLKGADVLAYPVAVLMIAYMFLDYGSTQYLEDQYGEKKAQYLVIKKENDPVRSALSEWEMKNEQLKQFIAAEFKHPDIMQLMNVLIAIANDARGELEIIRLSEGKLMLTIVARVEALELIQALNKTGYFQDIQKRQERNIRNTGYKKISLEAVVKPVGATNG